MVGMTEIVKKSLGSGHVRTNYLPPLQQELLRVQHLLRLRTALEGTVRLLVLGVREEGLGVVGRMTEVGNFEVPIHQLCELQVS